MLKKIKINSKPKLVVLRSLSLLISGKLNKYSDFYTSFYLKNPYQAYLHTCFDFIYFMSSF